MSPRVTESNAAALHARYEAIFEAIPPPFAFVDLDAFAANARAMLAQAGGMPVRVASKSIRSVDLLRRALALAGFRGVLAFTLPEALHLTRLGFDDVVVAYPTVNREAISEAAKLAAAGGRNPPVLMVDVVAQLDLIEATIGAGPSQLPVCIDIDASYWALRGRLARIGPKRSPIHWPWQAKRLAQEIHGRPGTGLAGVMAYEGQIAGVGDRVPGKPIRSALIRAMQSRSEADLRSRLPQIVRAIRGVAEPRFINGGGTGSLARTAAAGNVTELTAGSGFFAPALFDTYRSLDLTPAAFFVLPVVRRPGPGIVTALGGGYLASGSGTPSRLPQPYLPTGLTLDSEEGAGEVQTPLLGTVAKGIRVGDRIYMRHAKAGELCERFNSLYLVSGNEIVDEVNTYRGDGHAFL